MNQLTLAQKFYARLNLQPEQRAANAFLRAELDRIGPRTPMCRDFFRRAVALELSLFEAAYADPT